MILVIARGTRPEQTAEVLAELERLGLEGCVLRCGERCLIHVRRGSTRLAKRLVRMERVVGLVPTSGPRVRREGRRFFPYHFVNWSAATLLMMGVLVALAGFFPPGLGQRIDLRSAPASGARPGYSWALEYVSARLPGGGGMAWSLVLAVLAGLFALPYLDRSEGRGLRQRLPAVALGGVLLLAVLYLVLV